ncbi:MAG: hypothetical protein QNK24_08485 [Desulfuromusa sp.]|nr:hypothetical protein [Desulfuromusa sp.]
MNRYFKLISLIFFCSMFLLTGCQATTGSLLGATAPDDTLIDLSTKTGENQRWQDFYIIVDYTLNRQADKLSIDGKFIFSDYVKGNLKKVGDVKLWLFLLDDEKRVVEYKQVARTVSSNVDDSVNINAELSLSVEVTAIAFGYRGALVSDGRQREFIWKLPHKNK